MIAAFHELLAAQRQTKGIPDLRIAAFFIAIQKVGRSYIEMGIFP
jgi:glutamate dehydrogenase (NAD(P)+)